MIEIRPGKPEIMSPAGYWPQLQAAVEAGADAVYFGLKHFTARAKVGFLLEELPEVMKTLHQRGVKGYLTFNTLIFDHELKEASTTLLKIAATGVDAIIVQDTGIAKLAQKMVPSLELHGSTQMSITNAEGVRFAQQFGISRVVLARELSLEEIKLLRSQTNCELELFVHGALCVSYSGQCFSSEAWGGRSANRGQCAQACRLPYEMIVDGILKPLGDARYLLSPGDLYALHQIPEIVQIGISALKIEGRYKEADYVALTTSAYRKAVDEAWAGLPLSVSKKEEIQLEQVYSRGLGAYFISGTDHQKVVEGRSPRHRGLCIGVVKQVLHESVFIQPYTEIQEVAPLKAGDGIVFDSADWRSPEAPEEGGHIYEVTPHSGGILELHFGNDSVDFTRIRPKDLIWRTHDPELHKVARPWTQAKSPVHKQPLQVLVTAYEGELLEIEWILQNQPHIRVRVNSLEPLTIAQNQALEKQFLQEQLGRLGNTPYTLQELQLNIRGRPFVPSSLLNQLRRNAVEQLQTIQSEPKAPPLCLDPEKILEVTLNEIASHSLASEKKLPEIHLLIRSSEQLDVAIQLRPASITLDYLDFYGLAPSVAKIQATGIMARVASPRILKPQEQRIVQFLLSLNCPILVRSSGLIQTLQKEEKGPSLFGDFSLNIANVLSAHIFLEQGLLRFTPTYDLNAEQVSDLAQKSGASTLEVVAYQHLPVFHMEHCVFCRFLSSGTSYKDCGKPCEKHQLALRDKNGREHPVMADVGCRNTVFGAEAQSASSHLGAWRQAGIQHFRLEFVQESAEQIRSITDAFSSYFSGKLSDRELTHQLKKLTPQGITEGSFFVPKNFAEMPSL
ncbi:MAG: DUF3656 domain-containing protein [Planctomycetota bacterium]